MQWIETMFGMSPDGGSGATEALFVLAGLAIAALVVAGARQVSARRR